MAPGPIATERDADDYRHIDPQVILWRLAIKEAGRSEDIADACVYLCGEGGRYITGKVIHR